MSCLDETRLEKVSERAGHIVCRCPACAEEGHDKKGEHLSIWPSGKFACVQFLGPEGKEHRKRIFELVGIRDESGKPRTFPTLNDAIAAALEWIRNEKKKEKGNTLVRRRDDYHETRRDWYHDAYGNEVFVVVRFDAKGSKVFRPFYRDQSGRWVIGDPPGKLPLFNREELRKRPAEEVYLVEGEKCVCALRDELGLLATTSAHGAEAPEKSDWTPLAGRKVV